MQTTIEGERLTVTAAQLATLEAHSLNYTAAIADAANRTGCYLYLLVAMLEKETGTVRNVFGNDQGGMLAGFPKPVTLGNWEAFRYMVIVKGHTSNGVGPAQLTSPDLLRDCEGRGLRPWIAADNIRFGATLLWSYYLKARADGLGVRDSIRFAGRRYNGATAYGEDLLEVALKWKARLGNDDYL